MNAILYEYPPPKKKKKNTHKENKQKTVKWQAITFCFHALVNYTVSSRSIEFH